MLKKKLLREKRRKREQKLEEADESSNSDSAEEGLSKAKLVKSKLNHECWSRGLKIMCSGQVSSSGR